MTISTYHVDSVLKAYNKQTRMDGNIQNRPDNSHAIDDVVTLSSKDSRKETFDRISYNLVDVLLCRGSS